MRGAAIAVAGLLALALVVEALALPIASRVLSRELSRCVAFESAAVTRVARPVTPRLVVGRARDVEVEVTGVVVAGLRVDTATLALPLAVARWAPFAPEPSDTAVVVAEVVDTDVAAFLTERAPFGLEPTVAFRPGQVRIGVAPVVVTAALRVEDGVLRLAPGGLPPVWWQLLGLEAGLTLPSDLGVEAAALRDGVAEATLTLPVVAGVDGSPGCEGPLGEVGP